MWTGIPPKHHSTDHDASKPSAYFVCPQQPSLQLPLSRVNDGICDCCDGADERDSATTTCSDICDVVLAEERAAIARAKSAYVIGSSLRAESIEQYKQWHGEKMAELTQLKEVQMVVTEEEAGSVEQALKAAKISLARDWLSVVNDEVLTKTALVNTVGHGAMSLDDLASFIISLCRLSGEISLGNVANDRCVALDRASLDLGILWDFSSLNDDDEEGALSLPSFELLNPGSESALIDFAEKIVLRLEGKDTVKQYKNKNKKGKNKNNRRAEKHRDYHDSEDDPYGDDWEDYHDYDYDSGDEYNDGDVDDEPASEGKGEEDDSEKKEAELTPNELMVKSLLDKVPIDRSLFKEQSKRLLKLAQEVKDSEKSNEDGEAEESSAGDENDANDDSDESTTSDNNPAVDPMALQMVKGSLTKHVSNISRGEDAAKSAARFLASLLQTSNSPLSDMKNLAIMTMYHSKVSTEDVAELVYSTSSILRSTATGNDEGELSCSSPWDAIMCPTPRAVPLPNDGGTTYPPSFIVQAAKTLCREREASNGVCASLDNDVIDFPAEILDGYYNYYLAHGRINDEEDALTALFSSISSIDGKLPSNLMELKKRKTDVDKKKESLTKKVADLEHEVGGDGSKFGTEGELFMLRDTCHKVESGKYEYEVCVFGKATQRDQGQKSGGTNLGSWEKVELGDDGRLVLKWGGGTKCWNGPVRSAEVSVTCGAESKVLTADEPETCRYVFTMESPIACDEKFKLKNSL